MLKCNEELFSAYSSPLGKYYSTVQAAKCDRFGPDKKW